MVPDSDEINLSTLELQVLSELDRYVCDHAATTDNIPTNIALRFQPPVWIPQADRTRTWQEEIGGAEGMYCVVVGLASHAHSHIPNAETVFFSQAVRYLERMLVQANSQAEQVVEVKPQFEADGRAPTVDNGDVEMRCVEEPCVVPTSENQNTSQPQPTTPGQQHDVAGTDDGVIVKQETSVDGDAALESNSPAAAVATAPESAVDVASASTAVADADEADIKMEVDDDGGVVTTAEKADGERPETTADGDDETVESSGEDNAKATVVEESKGINIDPRTYCKLGHFHLLLEDYPKGE